MWHANWRPRVVIKRVWPVREMIASGALVVPGSDWSVVPSLSPWIGIETLVTREKPGGNTAARETRGDIDALHSAYSQIKLRKGDDAPFDFFNQCDAIHP